jgi:hypothetical protein
MDFIIGMGFVLCMLYLFYERENKKARPQFARASRGTASRSKRPIKRRTTKRFDVPDVQSIA